jgi:hypothetical protein
MTAYKELSEYYSDDKTKRASVIKELGTNKYIVKLINDSGSAFSASFDIEDDAEAYAESWVV